MVKAVKNINDLKSDILLVPHHGSDSNMYHQEWDEAVDPKAIIIGAAPNKGKGGYQHPRGTVIHKYLTQSKTRNIWDYSNPHGIFYWGNEDIQNLLQTNKRMFNAIPNKYNELKEESNSSNTSITEENKCHTQVNKWHLAWIDIPIYTLWSTGTVQFKGTSLHPLFIDAPRGLSHYIAVSDPSYLLPPMFRGSFLPLSSEHSRTVEALLGKINIDEAKIDETVISNFIQENLLMLNHLSGRGIYLDVLSYILPEKKYYNSYVTKIKDLNGTSSLNLTQFEWFFSSLRDFINQKGPYFNKLKIHINSATQKLVSSLDLPGYGVDSVIVVLKSFINSRHTIDQINDHIELYKNLRNVISSNEIIHTICPDGYYQWKEFWNKIGKRYYGQKLKKSWGNIDEDFSILDLENCYTMDDMEEHINSEIENGK